MGVYIKGMTLEEFSEYGDYCQTLIGTGQAEEVPPHGRLIDIDAPYQIQVHVDGLTKKGSVDIYAPAVLGADPAEEGE